MNYYAPPLMLLGLTILVLVLLYRWQKNHVAFDLSDLLTGDNGKVSSSKFAAMCALIVSTWGFVVLVQQGKMSSEYFIGYMITWAGAKLVQSGIDKKAPTP